MICCIGLLAGFFVGEILGVGPILAPIGFVAGLVGDAFVFRFLAGNKGEEKTKRALLSPCCAPPTWKRLDEKTERGDLDGMFLLHTTQTTKEEKGKEKRK